MELRSIIGTIEEMAWTWNQAHPVRLKVKQKQNHHSHHQPHHPYHCHHKHKQEVSMATIVTVVNVKKKQRYHL